jgi:hypothetical protein
MMGHTLVYTRVQKIWDIFCSFTNPEFKSPNLEQALGSKNVLIVGITVPSKRSKCLLILVLYRTYLSRFSKDTYLPIVDIEKVPERECRYLSM